MKLELWKMILKSRSKNWLFSKPVSIMSNSQSWKLWLKMIVFRLFCMKLQTPQSLRMNYSWPFNPNVWVYVPKENNQRAQPNKRSLTRTVLRCCNCQTPSAKLCIITRASCNPWNSSHWTGVISIRVSVRNLIVTSKIWQLRTSHCSVVWPEWSPCWRIASSNARRLRLK